MNVMLGATIGDKGLNVNVVDIGPLAVSKVPEAGVIALYDAVLCEIDLSSVSRHIPLTYIHHPFIIYPSSIHHPSIIHRLL